MESTAYVAEKLGEDFPFDGKVAEGVLAPWRAETNQIVFSLQEVINAQELTLEAMTTTSAVHLHQDSVGIRVVEVHSADNLTGDSNDIALFSFGDGVSTLDGKRLAYRSGLVSEIATTESLNSLVDAFSGVDGQSLVSELALKLKQPDARRASAQLLYEKVINPALVEVVTNIEAANVSWKEGVKPEWKNSAEFYMDKNNPTTINNLRTGRLPGSTSLVMGIVVPNPNPEDENTHFAYVFTICGAADAGRAYILRDDTYEAITNLYLAKPQFVKPETSVVDYAIKATRIGLRKGDKLIFTTDGLDKNVHMQKATDSGKIEAIEADLNNDSEDDRTILVITVN